MNIIKKSDATIFSNSDTCSGVEFPFDDKDINIAIAVINERYPVKGYVTNEVCKEIVYILGGSGHIGMNGKEDVLEVGDAILINPGEKYYWRGDNMQLIMICSPAFYLEQHKEVK